MVSVRQRRLNELLGEELSLLVPGRLDDPDLTGVVITRAEVTQDLTTAKVYYVAPDEAAGAALDRAQGYLRGQLANLGLRRVPRLVFARDRAFEEGQRVLDLLAELDLGAASGDEGADAGPEGGVDGEGVGEGEGKDDAERASADERDDDEPAEPGGA